MRNFFDDCSVQYLNRDIGALTSPQNATCACQAVTAAYSKCTVTSVPTMPVERGTWFLQLTVTTD